MKFSGPVLCFEQMQAEVNGEVRGTPRSSVSLKLHRLAGFILMFIRQVSLHFVLVINLISNLFYKYVCH